jgi:hypothetical protein
MSFLKFYFVARCQEFQEHFSAEAVDHSYDDVYPIVRKTVNSRLRLDFIAPYEE